MVCKFVNRSILFIIILFCFLNATVFITLLSMATSIHAISVKDNSFKKYDNINSQNKFYVPVQSYTSIEEDKLKLSEIMSSRQYNSQSYIPLNHNYLSSDPLNVYIISDQDDQKEGFVNNVIRGLSKWSDMLKTHSGNYLAWNINTYNIIKPPKINDILKTNNNADIVIELIKSDTKPCGELGGTVRPIDKFTKPIQIQLYTSCLFENNLVLAGHRVFYSTILHEFGHAMGLGHTYNKDGDLMCAGEDNNIIGFNSCIYSTLAEPSELDLDALIYMYGNDGFGNPNIFLQPNSYYPPNIR